MKGQGTLGRCLAATFLAKAMVPPGGFCGVVWIPAKTLVDALKPGSLVWDTEVKRFAVRRQADARVYLVKYRHAGRQRWVRIGAHGSPCTPDGARTEALRLLGLVADDADPAAPRLAMRDAPTVAHLCERFLIEHATPKLKPRTTAEYRKLITGIITPKLGGHRVADVTRDDIARLHHLLRATPAHANRLATLLSKLFNTAELWGLRRDGTNPVRHIRKFRERRRERYLTDAELARLGAVLETAHREGQVTPKPGADPLPVSSWAVAALRLLLFTGARSSEVLTCQWDYVDVAGACLRLPDSKTGAKRIPLNAPALAVVQALPRIEGNAYVFPSLARQRGHLVKLHPAWATIRSAAGLADVRIHDLRHAHASIGVSAGLSLPVVGKCAHAGSSAWRSRSPATDARYPSAPTPTPSWPAVVRGSDRLRFRHEELVRLPDGVAGRLPRAKVDDFRFHDLRHTFASWLVQRGRSLKEVQDALGHRTLAMTSATRTSHPSICARPSRCSTMFFRLGHKQGTSCSASPEPRRRSPHNWLKILGERWCPRGDSNTRHAV